MNGQSTEESFEEKCPQNTQVNMRDSCRWTVHIGPTDASSKDTSNDAIM